VEAELEKEIIDDAIAGMTYKDMFGVLF